ncbi:flavin reductase family protein [Kitasatospora paranensis]|uniref:Flavin reductase family protein n=1 Tax=Kitasatospora paranensis TaxID=258053 RepID=A0ABW2G3N8_9ACTN
MSAPARTGTPGAEAFRGAARHWATGVAVVTADFDGEVFAKTVSSFCTLSLDPLLVSVAVTRHSPIVAAVRSGGRFAVSVLSDRQAGVARRFATPGAGRALGSFTAVPMRTETTGAPVLEAALAWFDCHLHAAQPGGDHTLLIGRVAAADATGGRPLLHHDGQFRTLAPTPLTATGVGA